jgi:hypothetical protein
MLVVIVITVIVVGIAFSVLSLVLKQIRGIEENFQKTTELSLLEQRLWQDFNKHNFVVLANNKITVSSISDTIVYIFENDYILRDLDTIPLKTEVQKAYYLGRETSSGYIDAVSISAYKEVPDYSIFVSAKHDAAHFINKDGI